MAIPDFQSIMLPLLKLSGDEREHRFSEATEELADEFGLSQAERAQLLPSGTQKVFRNRVGWARTYLVKAGLLEATRRGFFRIAARGSEVLAENPPCVDVKYLERFPGLVAFRAGSTSARSESPGVPVTIVAEETPEETLEYAYERLRQELAQQVLAQVVGSSPAFFEKLVVELLVKMGYGGSMRDAGEATRSTKDGGIDGIIKEDRLGLDIIYIQAKRWQNTVDRTELQKFAGALQGQRARKGVFITTSHFSTSALEYVKSIETKIVPIDGEQLAQLMIDHDIGVTTAASYAIKKIDSDYFSEE